MKTEFIATSTALLRWLQEIRSNDGTISFKITDQNIHCSSIMRDFSANELRGHHTFEYNIDKIYLLIDILKPIPEQPLTFVFTDSWICINGVSI